MEWRWRAEISFVFSIFLYFVSSLIVYWSHFLFSIFQMNGTNGSQLWDTSFLVQVYEVHSVFSPYILWYILCILFIFVKLVFVMFSLLLLLFEKIIFSFLFLPWSGADWERETEGWICGDFRSRELFCWPDANQRWVLVLVRAHLCVQRCVCVRLIDV